MLLLLAHSWHGPDIWYHLTWGRELVESGRWLPQPRVLLAQPIPANGYWLFQAPMYLLYLWGGVKLVSAVFALLWVGIAALWLKLSGLHRTSYGLWFALAFVAVAQLRFEQRPEVLSYLYLLLMFWCATERRIWGLLLVQILWANTHGFFVLGPILGALVYYQTSKKLRRTFLLAGVLLAATLVNPFGYKIWTTVALYLKFGRALSDLNHELFSPALWPPQWPISLFWLVWLFTLGAVGLCLRRRHWELAQLAGLGLYLSAQATRNVPLLFMLTPWVWRDVKVHLSPRLQTLNALLVVVIATTLSASVINGHYHTWVGSLSTFGVKLESSSYPIHAAEFLKNGRFAGRIFADSYDGGYLEFHLPDVHVTGDSYFTDEAQTRRFFRAIKEPAALMQLVAELRLDVLVINVENRAVIKHLLDGQDWLPAFADLHRIVFVNRAGNPHLAGDLAAFTFYRDENLRQWTYEFGIVSWVALAFERRSAPLMIKILTDLKRSPYIPPMAFNLAVQFAAQTRDDNLARLLGELRDRAI